ncbi:MAG: aromatic ring-hydroxylating oxygenase subunit alpha [Ktedonobacterales bacterium]
MAANKISTWTLTIDFSTRLREALDQGYTLPARWYTRRDVFRLEQRRIFRRSWQYAGLVEQLPHAGDFFTYRTGELSLVILRDDDQRIRAFVNVCRHRGSQLILEEHGHRSTLQCHYHAWTYNLDGSLRAAPGMKDEESFDKDDFWLFPVSADTWGPFIFVNPDAHARPLAETLGELPNLVDATGLDLSKLRHRVRRSYDIAANWKVVVDNYLECYHCPVAHPSFCDLIDVGDYVVREYDYFSTQTGALKESAKTARPNLYDVSGGAGQGVQDGFYAYFWPNFTVNIYPGPGNVSLNLFIPLDVNRTLAVYDYCFVDEVGAPEEENFIRFIDKVQQEDIVLCESVQRGLRSGYFDQGKLMLSRENGLRHFQKLVYQELVGDADQSSQ